MTQEEQIKIIEKYFNEKFCSPFPSLRSAKKLAELLNPPQPISFYWFDDETARYAHDNTNGRRLTILKTKQCDLDGSNLIYELLIFIDRSAKTVESFYLEPGESVEEKIKEYYANL